MAARFILSLDCEGKWGVADHLTRRHHHWLSDERLRQAYRGVVDVLDEFEVPATFAFVGLFAEPEDSFKKLTPAITHLAAQATDYLSPALFDASAGSRQGWHGAWAVEAVSNAKVRHEIALHGVTHVPWTSQGRDFFAQELALFRELSPPLTGSRTFVFPRNAVAHLELLGSEGFEGYRVAPRHRSRALSLLSEFNFRTEPERDFQTSKADLIPIPAGFFVNWRHGIRRLVPRWLTRARFRRLLDNEESGVVIHAWMHPENIASAPESLDVLRDVVTLVASKRDSGRCVPMTQIDYVRRLRSPVR